MIAVEKENKINKNKDGWNYCHNMPILPLFGGDHCIPLLHMSKRFIWLEEIGESINEFEIGYMINTSLHVSKAFK